MLNEHSGPSLILSSKNVPNLPNFRIDDTGTITLHFKITGANKYDDEAGLDDEISYTMECSVESISTEKINLSDAVERAANKDIYVATRTTPAP